MRAVVDVLEHVVAEPGPGAGRPVHLVGNSLGGLVSLLVAARRPELVASLSLISPAMPVLPGAAGVRPAVPLLLVPGIASVAERRMAGIPPEETVRGLIEMCFGDPSRVAPRAARAGAVQELRERAEQPWADRALVRTMRGLMTSYLRVGRSAAWRPPAASAARRWCCGATATGWSTPASPRGWRRRCPTRGCWCWRASGTWRCSRRPSPPPAPSSALLEDAGRAAADEAAPGRAGEAVGSLAG